MPRLPIGVELRNVLLEYDWPGNIRELENTMRKYLVLRSESLLIQELQTLIRLSENRNDDQSVLDNVKNRVEREVTLDALEKANWNQKQAARLLKIDYRAFLYRMKKLGIERKESGSRADGLETGKTPYDHFLGDSYGRQMPVGSSGD